jgi:hypothetical protein
VQRAAAALRIALHPRRLRLCAKRLLVLSFSVHNTAMSFVPRILNSKISGKRRINSSAQLDDKLLKNTV